MGAIDDSFAPRRLAEQSNPREPVPTDRCGCEHADHKGSGGGRCAVERAVGGQCGCMMFSFGSLPGPSPAVQRRMETAVAAWSEIARLNERLNLDDLNDFLTREQVEEMLGPMKPEPVGRAPITFEEEV